MGCCGDKEDNDENTLLHQPLTTTATVTTTVDNLKPSNATTYETLSPLNSNFTALICHDTLRLIFQKLPITDLARSACVCRIWSSVASEQDIQTTSFMSPWKLRNIVGIPSSGSFWKDTGLNKFAISHRICKGDSVASLAVKYSVQVMDVKRLNNMMSEHGIYSRERLLIPVSNPDILIDSTCYIELDSYAKREVAVLYLEGSPCMENQGPSSSKAASEEGKKRVLESIKRSMQVDDGTALYYLSVSNGDPRAAWSEFSEDVTWERHAGLA